MGASSNSILLYSGRAKHYARFRPGYPKKVISFLNAAIRLKQQRVVADIGAGTGKFSRLLIENGHEVIGIEPNNEMFKTLKRINSDTKHFKAIVASAERTTLGEKSIDALFAAQSFHWFRVTEARKEFMRILKEGKYCVFLWNDRDVERTAFMKDYENFLQEFSPRYFENEALWSRTETVLDSFFSRKSRARTFEHRVEMNLEALWGLYLSYSHTDVRDSSRVAIAHQALKDLFLRNQHHGNVFVYYRTIVHLGTI